MRLQPAAVGSIPISPAIDPSLRAGLANYNRASGGPLREHNLTRQRALMAAASPTLATLKERASVLTVVAPRAEGSPGVELLVLRPKSVTRRLPAIYFMHAGGMVMGDNRHGLDTALEWMAAIPAAIVAPDYRLAPEHPHPAASEDCYAGLCWTSANSDSLGVDAHQIVVAGFSAGGGLAAAVSLMARDRGGPPVHGQVALGPMLDDRRAMDPGNQLEDIGPWDRSSDDFAWRALLGRAAGSGAVSDYAAPARAANLAGLPPAFFDVGSVEIFRDQTVDYAKRLWQAGGQAELHVWPGAFHGFDRIVPSAPISQAARRARIEWLTRRISPA